MIDILVYLSNINRNILIFVIIIFLILEVYFLSFPKEIILVYSGFVYGFLLGGIINQIGLFGATWLGFEGGYFGRFGLEKKLKHPLIKKYQNWLNEFGLKSLLVLRIFPLTPNDILSITSGFCKLKRIPYLIISFLFALPYAFFWAYLGAYNLQMVRNYVPSVFDTKTWAISFIIIIIVGLILIRKGNDNSKEGSNLENL